MHVRAVVLAAVVGLIAARVVSAFDPESWDLVLLEEEAKATGAVCLDGTPPGYYIRKGTGTDGVSPLAIGHTAPRPPAPSGNVSGV